MGPVSSTCKLAHRRFLSVKSTTDKSFKFFFNKFFPKRKKMCSLPVVRVWDILKNLGYNCKLFLIQKLVKTYQKHQFHVVVIIRKSFKMCNFITRCCPHPRNWRCVCFSLSLGRFRLRGVVGGGLCTLCTHHIYEPTMFTVGLPSRCTG